MVLASLVLALLIGASRPPEILPRPRLHVLVRLERHAALDDSLLTAVAAEVRKIWRPYGIDVALVFSDDASCPHCDEELRLIITDRPPPKGGWDDPAGLGWIEFVAPGQPAPTITVSAAVAWHLTEHATFAGSPIVELPFTIRDRFVTHALSRAAAHEIGHYLLRSTAHARSGLMRRRFTVVEIMDENLGRYRLEPAEVEGLERQLAEGAHARQPRVTSSLDSARQSEPQPYGHPERTTTGDALQ